MEPLTLAIAGSFVASCVAHKCADAALEGAWTGFVAALRGRLGREPDAADLPEAADLIPPWLSARLASTVQDESCLRRARLVEPALVDARILWVDDRPENNRWERNLLEALGVHVDCAESTRSALDRFDEDHYHLIVSDIARAESPTAGLDGLGYLAHHAPVVFYVGQIDKSLPVPVGSFGIADRPDELLHLVLDVLERARI